MWLKITEVTQLQDSSCSFQAESADGCSVRFELYCTGAVNAASRTGEISGIEKLSVASLEEAGENCESPVQLLENCEYVLKCDSDWKFSDSRICRVSPVRDRHNEAFLKTGSYIGTAGIPIQIIDKPYLMPLEIRSRKINYREDYRFMLEEISGYCVEILMQSNSIAFQSFSVDYDRPAASLYQQFAFIKSFLQREEFVNAVHKVISSPVSRWCETSEERDIRRVGRVNRAVALQIASGSNRLTLPKSHPLLKQKRKIESVPRRVLMQSKKDTVDIPENRFIKHVLTEFCSFCNDIKKRLEPKNGKVRRNYQEAAVLEQQFENHLSHAFFRGISAPEMVRLNSPVLQRREGYREIVADWLRFQVAAALTWEGGEDVYRIGMRDVAALYEYWLFFRLFETVNDLFEMDGMNSGDEENSSEKLVNQLFEQTNDGINMKLKSGRNLVFQGKYTDGPRDLHLQFCYNKTFSDGKASGEQGSWTREMRPDYTVSLWPEIFSQQQAEEQELIVHIHFDSKYRMDVIKEQFDMSYEKNEDEYESDELPLTERKERLASKRSDLLKMHAYRDAIRRTGGAYVLYPGNDGERIFKGFHEVLPGLGAFAVRPERENDGMDAVKDFLREVIEHLQNRVSSWERLSYKKYQLYRKNPQIIGYEIPEKYLEQSNGQRIDPDKFMEYLQENSKSNPGFKFEIKSPLESKND